MTKLKYFIILDARTEGVMYPNLFFSVVQKYTFDG